MGLLFILVSLVWRCEHDSGVFPLTSGWKDVTRSSSWSAVHCGNESRWQTVYVAARACTRWWSPATRTLICPSKPIVFCLFRHQREYRSAWGRRKKKKNTPPHSQMPEFAKGLWVVGIHRCVFKNFIMNPAETCAPEQTSCRCKVPKLRKR